MEGNDIKVGDGKYTMEGLEGMMNKAIENNIKMQMLGIQYQEGITAVNVTLAQVSTRAAKQVPQG
mgnify:CR=1 FL=1